MKNLVITIGILFYIGSSNAAVLGEGEIEIIYPTGSKINFRLKNDSCNNTANNEYYYINMDTQQPAAKNWYALLLTASATGKPISVSVLSCAQVRYIFQKF